MARSSPIPPESCCSVKRPEPLGERRAADAAALTFFLVLALIFFAPDLFGGASLLPLDNLYRFPPWQQFAQTLGVGPAHNPLLDDLVLENYPWKKFILDSLRQGELPLWNPYILAGQPFLAAGQNAALYPFSVIFYMLPLTLAYGLFVALHFWIAAAAMYLLARVLRLGPLAATVAAIVYAFSGFMVVSVVFPMVISAAAWLPAILAAIELTLREERKRLVQTISPTAPTSTTREQTKEAISTPEPPYSLTRELLFALGAAALLGVQFLAGHIEISYYILMVVAFYGVWHVIEILRFRHGAWILRLSSSEINEGRGTLPSLRRWGWGRLSRHLVQLGIVIGGIVALGFGLAAVQLIPLYELLQGNFRAGSVSYDQVAGWALPIRQVFTFFIPDFFGNPTHHSYLDVFDWTTKAAPTGTIFWGIKNYVEAGSYVGLLPLALALVAVVVTAAFYVSRWRAGGGRGSDYDDPLRAPLKVLITTSAAHPSTLFFAVLAALSLLFAFGTPLYAVLFYTLPGYNQLHTAFRWIFPFTLSIAFLAGAGIQALCGFVRPLVPPSRPRVSASPSLPAPPSPRPPISIIRRLPLAVSKNALGLFAWAVIGCGLALISILGLSLIWHTPFITLSDWIIVRSSLARPVFVTGQAFWSYEFRNLFIFGIFLTGAGVVLRLAPSSIRLPKLLGAYPLWQPLALTVIVLDLFVFGFGFNPASDPRLLDFVPPSIQFLQSDHSIFRVTSYDLPGRSATNPDTGMKEDVPPQRVFNPNAGMYFGIEDIRGYDSIIPKQYAEYMGALAPQDELLFNRIAPFYDYQPLSSPLLDLLNVKYVLTTRPVPNPGYKLVYDHEIKIYENEHVLPRAFLVPQARVIPDRANLLKELTAIDPAEQVLLEEGTPLADNNPGVRMPTPAIEKYSGSEVVITATVPYASYLVLSDSYYPGWIAQIDDEETQIYRADYNFRAVIVPAGTHTVRFKYSPLSFKVGGVTSLVAATILLLGMIAVGWRRFAPEGASGEGEHVRVVAKNSIVPMAASFLNQGLNFAAQFVILRLLGPTGAGRYAFAVIVWLYWSTITDFGLGLLMTREVSRDRSLSNRYLTNTAVLRMFLTLASLIPLALLIFFFAGLAGYVNLETLAPDTVTAILLLWLSLIPANLAASLSFLFNAHEQFEYPTVATVATNMLSISLQIAALLLGYGIVGMAAVSIVANSFTLLMLFYLVRSHLFAPRWELDPKLMRWMFFESYPLMMNNLLSSLFFRIDNFILQPLRGDTVLGYYNTGYKFINALNFIPSNFTLAIFPLLSRYATDAKEAMQRALILSIKLLLWISLPIVVATAFIAYQIIGLYGGDKFLPDSAIALQWLIWFLPFSFVNSVVHYVLIALNQQRFLTKAFSVGLLFNIVANVIAIQALSYRGAALVTVLSEIVLLIPFYYSLHKNLASLPFLDILWRPVAAAAGMAATLYLLLPRLNLFVGLAAASLLYVVVLLLLGAVGHDEWLLARRLAPRRLDRVLAFVSRSNLS
jgi:O-antigen/teichoic acid export membrane protein